MPAPTVTIIAPPPTYYPDGADGILRPRALVKWTGGTGPFDVLHEWDTVPTFDSGALLQDDNTGATSPDTGVPPGDLGGGTWYYRVTVTDTADAAETTPGAVTLEWFDQIDAAAFLYLFANLGVGFTPTDDPAGGWGPDPDAIGPDGDADAADRFLYLLANLGVGFDPTDGETWGEGGEPYDGYTVDFARALYLLAGDVNTDTPTPHIWYVFPTFGREGWEFQVVGYGFGDTQGTYTGTLTLNDLAVGIISWELVAETGADMEIDPITNTAEPVHQLIRATVPAGGESGLLVVCTDGP